MTKCLVQDALEQLRYALRGGRAHLLDELVGVLVQELVDRLAQDVARVHVVAHLEPCVLQRKVHPQLLNVHVGDAVLAHHLLAVELGDRTDVG